MKKLISIIISFLLITSSAFSASIEIDNFEYPNNSSAAAAYVTNAIESVNQEQTTVDDVSSSNIGNNNGEVRYAQSFKLSASDILSAFEIKTGSAVVGSPTGNWTFRIETDNGGVPSGMLADTNSSVVVTPVGTANTVVKKAFDKPFILAANTTYWFIVQCDNQTNGNYWNLGRNTAGGYADGTAAYSTNGGVSWTAFGQDLYFKAYVISLQSYSEDTLITQGSYALKVVAAITDSLNKTLTKTFSTNHNLTGVKNLRLDAYALRTGSNFKIGLHDTGGTTTELTPTISTSNTWQPVNWDLSGVSDANKDSIDQLILTITNADSSNTVYLDYFEIAQTIDTFGWIN